MLSQSKHALPFQVLLEISVSPEGQKVKILSWLASHHWVWEQEQH